MKKLSLLVLSLGVLGHAQVRAQYFTDMFTGTFLNSTYWQATTPYSDSTASVTNGVLLISNAGRVITVPTLPASVDFTIKFAFTGGTHNNFKITTRNSGALSGPFFISGMLLQIQMQSDTGSTANNVTISVPSTGQTYAQATYPIALNQTYTVRVVDDGAHISLYLNDTSNPLLTTISTVVGGHAIGLQCREGAAAGSSISANSQVQVSAFTINESTTVTNTVTVTAPDTSSHLINLSTLGAGPFSMGFAVSGTNPKTMLVRAVGPALSTFGLSGVAASTTLSLYSGTKLIAANSGWSTAANVAQISAAFTSTQAFALPFGSADSALLVSLNPGVYSAQATGSGQMLVEVYDAGQ